MCMINKTLTQIMVSYIETIMHRIVFLYAGGDEGADSNSGRDGKVKRCNF